MKKKCMFITFLMACMLTLACVVAAPAETTAKLGWERNIHVEWGYTPPLDLTVLEFRLYQSGALVCAFQDGAATSGDCKATLSRSSTPFTLTAAFSDGSESPHSVPFSFADFGPGPQILILVAR